MVMIWWITWLNKGLTVDWDTHSPHPLPCPIMKNTLYHPGAEVGEWFKSLIFWQRDKSSVLLGFW